MKARILSAIAGFYLRLVGITSRIIWVNRSIRDEHERLGRGVIYAFWHGRQVFLVYTHRNDGTRPLVSKSRDGEIIARVCRAFGMDPIRGSTSRGGVGALLEVQEALGAGRKVSFTPDGPRGPLREVQKGVLYAAQKSGCPIVPMAFGARKKWIFGSWDEFIVPKPFNRISMVYGEPLQVSATDNLDQRARDLKRALDQVAQEADSVAGRCHG